MTIILDWFGPYSDLYKVAPGQALVALSGKEPYKRKAKFYYLGICKGSMANSKVSQVKRERRYWHCEVAHAPVLLPNVLEIAEQVLASFWRPDFREPTKQLPLTNEPMTFVMRYFKPNRTPRAARPSFHGGNMPTVIQWDGKKWWSGKGMFMPPG